MYFWAGRDSSAVSTPCASNPASTRSRRYMLFIKSPAPVSSMSASATSPTTSALVRRRRPPAAPGEVSLSDSRRSIDDPWSAGSKPNSTPVKSETSSVNASTWPSTLTSRMRGSSSWPSELSASVAQKASKRPAAPPSAASRTLSVRSWRRMRPRLAPSAARMAISRRRAAARTNKRFARFAQAMSSTNPTAPSSTTTARRTPPTIESSRRCRSIVSPRDSANWSAICRAMPVSSRRACCSVTERRSLPTTPMK